MSLATILAVGAVLVPPAPCHTFSLSAKVSAQESTSTQSAPPAAPAQEAPKESAPTGAPGESSKPTEPEVKPKPPAGASPTPNSEPAAPPVNPPESKPPKPAPKTVLPNSTKRKRVHKAATQPGSAPTKRVVRNGSTTDPEVQLSPGLTQEQASNQRQTTAQLLASTEANLKKLSGRQLNLGQQDVVSQIHKYMAQAKEADDEGDLQRARNLAFKAHLLSDDLAKH